MLRAPRASAGDAMPDGDAITDGHVGPEVSATYPPLNLLKRIISNIWIVDSGPLLFMGVPLRVRMTVVRSRSGDLWLHSPTIYHAALMAQLEQLGRVRHLVAANVLHWRFIKAWQHSCPASVSGAVPALRKRHQVQRKRLSFPTLL